MSSNPPQNTTQQDLFKTRRVHRIIRRFKRGKDKKLHFDGQEPDEEVRRVVREHFIFALRSATPFFAAIILLFLVIWGNTAYPGSEALWRPLELFASLAIVGAGLYSAYRIFELWWVNVDVITNRRILTWKGLLQPTRKETKLEKVSQVSVDQRSLFAMLFNYGDVKVYVSGGQPLDMLRVANPREVRDDIEGVRQSYQKAAEAKKVPPPPVLDQQLSAVLTKLATPKPLPGFPDIDRDPKSKWAHRYDPTKLRGPLRTFGGFLNIPCDVHYDAEEYTVQYIQRSKIVLFYELFFPVLILLLLLVGALTARILFGLFAVLFFVGAIAIGLIILNYIDDVFILTNKRIIDIERHFVFFFEEHDTANYDRISEIQVESPNLFELALNVGNVHVYTPGSNPDIHMTRVPDPFALQDRIFELQELKSKFDKTKAENDRKVELNNWFSHVLSTLEPKLSNRGVPDFQTMNLWDAIDRADEVGMRVVPVGESSGYPHIPPGRIVSQVPPPGTVVEMNPENRPQIHVVLSSKGKKKP